MEDDQGIFEWIERIFGILVVGLVLVLAAVGCIAVISIDFLVGLLPSSIEGFVSPLAILAMHGLALLLVFRVNTKTPLISRLAGYLGGYLFMVIADNFLDYSPEMLMSIKIDDATAIGAGIVAGVMCSGLVSLLNWTSYLSVPIFLLSSCSLLLFSYYLATPPEAGLRQALILGSFSFLGGVVLFIMLLPRRFDKLFQADLSRAHKSQLTVLDEPPPEPGG